MIPVWAALIYGLVCGVLGVLLGAGGAASALWAYYRAAALRELVPGRGR